MKFLIPILIKIVMWCILMLIGMWYLYSSINEQAFPYISMSQFLSSVGACQGGECDISAIKGCFLCPFIEKLFNVVGNAAISLWDAIMTTTWILLAVGLIIFMLYTAYKTIKESSDENIKLSDSERKFDFKKWFDGAKSQFIRIMVAGAVLGVVEIGGHETLQQVSNVIIYPVMSVGTAISSSMTDVAGNAVCEPKNIENTPMAGLTKSFVCVVANLNIAILKGASLGFAIGDGVFAGMGGGFFIWISGFAIVLMFLYLGFNILFQVMNVMFNLVFVVAFMPLIVAAYAFENTWSMAKGVTSGAIGLLGQTAVRIIGITLNVMAVTALVSYSMDSLDYDPALSMQVGQKCENMSKLPDGSLDKKQYAECFKAERENNPNAFGFLDKGWDVFITMGFMFIAYKLLIEERMKKFITSSEDEGAFFRFGDAVKGLGSAGWNGIKWLIGKIPGLK